MFKKSKKAKTKKKKTETNVSDEEMDEVKIICNRLNLGKQPNVKCRLYHFDSHLQKYQVIDRLFQRHSNDSFEQFVNQQKQSWCRDVKSAIYAKGGIVPLSSMK